MSTTARRIQDRPVRIRGRVTIHPLPITGYLFAVAVFYLAAAYLGGGFPYVLAVLLFVPILSILHAVYAAVSVRLRLETQLGATVRGEMLRIPSRVAHSREVPYASWRIFMRLLTPYGDQAGERSEGVERVVLTGARSRRLVHTVDCRHRGDYRLQVGPAEIDDMLGWITLRTRPEIVDFHVYPRILNLSIRHLGAPAGTPGARSGAGRSHTADPSRFRGLARYREGMPIRHIAWKKFAAHGQPYIKEYDSSQTSGVAIYLDLRRIAMRESARADAEDHAMEVFVSLVRSMLEAHVPVDVYGTSTPIYTFSGAGRHMFDEFYLGTRHIRFNGDLSPQKVLNAHMHDGRVTRPSVVVISHLPDENLIELPYRVDFRDISCDVIFAATTWSWQQREKAKRLAPQSYTGIQKGRVYVLEDIQQLEDGVEL